MERDARHPPEHDNRLQLSRRDISKIGPIVSRLGRISPENVKVRLTITIDHSLVVITTVAGVDFQGYGLIKDGLHLLGGDHLQLHYTQYAFFTIRMGRLENSINSSIVENLVFKMSFFGSVPLRFPM